jgi:hypothetical protein
MASDTPAWLRALQRGCCSRSAAAEKGCARCVPAYDALDRLAALVGAVRLWRDAPDRDLHVACFAMLDALDALEGDDA